MIARTFANPVPGVILGDPFVLRWRARFYMYGTNDGPPLADGRQIPVFVSDDLIRWEPLGGALIPTDPAADHWAPEVLAWNGRFFMVVSFGDVDRHGHALWVAEADRPEGPFTLQKRVSDPSEKFSIDGSYLLDDDGALYLFRCLDFVESAPFGTGIVVQKMRDPMTPDGPAHPVLRAHSPWQLFLPDRTMPLYGGQTFPEWTTIEGPAPVKRNGRYYCGYSGGNYTGAYGTGEAVADSPLGPYTDLRGHEGPIFATTPGLVEGPGHFSVISSDGLHDWIVLHGRRPGEGGRRVWLCPVEWNHEGVTIGPLTDETQPRPPLPRIRDRFTADSPAAPPGWTAEGGDWRVRDGALCQGSETAGACFAWREGPGVSGEAFAEVYVRFPGPTAHAAGLAFRAGDRTITVAIEPGDARLVVAGAEGDRTEFPLPILGGEAFAADRFHALGVRTRGGRAEIRIDGGLAATGVAMPPDPARLGLFAFGPAGFDGLSASGTP